MEFTSSQRNDKDQKNKMPKHVCYNILSITDNEITQLGVILKFI